MNQIYEQKYLKYKAKYLELKNTMIGGVICPVCGKDYTPAAGERCNCVTPAQKEHSAEATHVKEGETFHIFVSGIGFHAVLDKWISSFRDHIINLIPARFIKIEIKYYDPLEGHAGESLSGHLKYLNTNLIKKDKENPRLNSNFYNDYLPIEVICRINKKSYIIIDLAHAFIPSKKGFVISNEYGNANKEEKKEEFEVVWLYPQSYLGDIKDGEYFEYFRVKDDNTIITYYDRLFDKGINYNDFSDSSSDEYLSPDNKLYQIMYRINPKINEKNAYFKLGDYPMEYTNKKIQDKIINIHLRHMGISAYNLKKVYLWDRLWDDKPYSLEKLLQLPKLPEELQKTIDDDIEKELNLIKKPEFKK